MKVEKIITGPLEENCYIITMSIQIGRERGNAMNLQSSKKTIFSFLKDKNFLSTANKRIFVQDCGFYLIVVEIVPLRKEGFFLNYLLIT